MQQEQKKKKGCEEGAEKGSSGRDQKRLEGYGHGRVPKLEGGSWLTHLLSPYFFWLLHHYTFLLFFLPPFFLSFLLFYFFCFIFLY